VSDTNVHVITFGPTGSYPRALCGYRGGSGGRMIYAGRAAISRRPADACPACLAALDEVPS
jgi:hypothetical protein